MIRPATGPFVKVAGHHKRALSNRTWSLLGAGYVVFTLTCGIAYVILLEPSLANNRYWPRFNTSGFETFLVDVVNLKLMDTKSGHVDMTSSDAIMHKSYANDDVQPQFAPNYARRLLFTELNTLSRAIRDLRNTSKPTRVYAQYCWVDFERRWDIAHTVARSMRCREYYTANGANYLETLFRNTDWMAFATQFSLAWPIMFGLTLATTPDGATWLAERLTSVMQLSVDDEVGYLESLNITRYELQWQNGYEVNIVETIGIQNALGVTDTVTVKSLHAGLQPWTSVLLYWMLYNDLNEMQSFNASMVRGASNSLESLGIDLALVYGVDDGAGHFLAQAGVFVHHIGPFGAVDAFYVVLPHSFVSLYKDFQTSVTSFLSSKASTTASFSAHVPLQMTPLPPNFGISGGATFFGGNLLCLDNTATVFPQAQISFYDACTESMQWTIPATTEAIMFAMLAAGLDQFNASLACAYQTSTTPCLAVLTQLQSVVATGVPTYIAALLDAQQTPWIDDAPDAMFVQYAQNARNEWFLLQQPLLTPQNPHWSFYGWLAYYDWIQGTREVVRFEGDVATMTFMSEIYPTVYFPSSSNAVGSSNDSHILYYLIVYTSSLSVFVGLFVVGISFSNGLAVDGRHFFVFNRVAASIWIGRPLLFLRGLTALVVLSSSQARLVNHFEHVQFVFMPRSLWATLIIVGESTWVTYITTDVFLVLAKGGSAKYVAPPASAVAFVGTLFLEWLHPISPVFISDRQCTVLNTDKTVQCQSGVFYCGQSDRLLLLVGLHVISALAFLVCLKWRKPPRHVPSFLLLHGTAEALFDHPEESRQLDHLSCLLSGLIPLSYRGRQYTFDIKLWILLPAQTRHVTRCGTEMVCQTPAEGRAVLVNPHSNSPMLEQQPSLPWIRLKAATGLVYVFLTGAGSVSYIALSSVNLANDFYWATFNLTGHHVALSNWFTDQLLVSRKFSATRLDDPKWSTMEYNYSSPTSTGQAVPLLGQRLQFEDLTSIAMAIQGLRRTDSCYTPWIFIQYCWIDFNRQWSIANSAKRDIRCMSQVCNGAVYLETMLRNVDWKKFQTCWGRGFELAFGNELASTIAGKTWLATVASNSNSIEDEINDWTSAGIVNFVVQWQDYKTTGLVNTYAIENAFGVQYSMTLSRNNGSMGLSSQTTFIMYWGLANDLWAVASNTSGISGQSLIRSSHAYAFTNLSMLDILALNGTLYLPLVESYQLSQHRIGPFGSIDMKHIACPEHAKMFVATSLDILRRTTFLNTSASTAFSNISMHYTTPIVLKPPVALSHSSWLAQGGSILCPNFGPATLAGGMSSLTSNYIQCGQVRLAYLYANRNDMVVAAVASQVVASDIQTICAFTGNPSLCSSTFLRETMSFLPWLPPSDAVQLETLAVATKTAVEALAISILQFIRANVTSPLEFSTTVLLDPATPSFAFWSWLYLCSWVKGERDVIRFEGDAGAIHLLTEQVIPTNQSPQGHEYPTAFAMYVRTVVQYVTGVMLGVAGLVLFYVVSSRGLVEGMNLFELNRVAGIVWVGRPLLLLRGVTALGLLSTATLELHIQHGVSYFRVLTLPWYKTILGAGEAVWLVYVVHDLFMVWTKQYTLFYAGSSSILVWVVVAMLTLVNPVMHQVMVEPQCQISQMDLQLECQSGLVQMGHVRRLYCLLGVIGLCNFVCAVAAWYCKRRVEDIQDERSLLLSAGAKYLFESSHWTRNHVYYIDPASALLNGLVSWRWRTTLYVLDIKLWRVFTPTANVDGHQFRHLAQSIPLTD
ncbi:Aste57867_24624 [Aphanomyces stellatus]|uniref:Aste57867_24624 protein n=1 Tax=Aphanomyces stellatus TaxID=120398 RepID=A0A485LV77_9STRA|nr:hypothetical protein As57867_024546 [Aphanomyces stellatus]VFU01261.1 Aste57867_24624 [Aphanomyces stellatus]